LAAGFHPNPLGSLSAPPYPLAAINRGPTSKGRKGEQKEKRLRGGKGREGGGREGEGEEKNGKEREGGKDGREGM